MKISKLKTKSGDAAILIEDDKQNIILSRDDGDIVIDQTSEFGVESQTITINEEVLFQALMSLSLDGLDEQLVELENK